MYLNLWSVAGSAVRSATSSLEYRRLADSWYLFDNSGGTPAVVAFERAGKPRIMNHEQYQALIERYGDE